MKATPFEAAAAVAWDELVADSSMGTLLHTRRFLGYHGDRFQDASLLLHDGGGQLAAVLPAAVDRTDPQRVASHPGATYGGLVHDGSLSGAAMLEALTLVKETYGKRGFATLRYAPVPWIYQRRPSGDDLYALFRLGAERTRCDLSCAVALDDGPRLSSRRRRGLTKARREGVDVAEGPELVAELWAVVERNLAERHGARPVHSKDEMRLLVELFPEEIAVVVARHAGQVVAGVVLFETTRVSHAQYIASTEAGNGVGALDAVFDHCFTRAREQGRRYFDLGTSNRDAGVVLNDGLYDFKAQFGGGGVAYEFYDVDLRTATPNPVAP
jgi:hypothetical protein